MPGQAPVPGLGETTSIGLHPPPASHANAPATGSGGGGLVFDASFDSGNAARVEAVGEDEYALWTRRDCEGTPHETGGRPDVRGLGEELAAAGLPPKLCWWQCPELLAMVVAIESWRQRALGVQPELHTGAKMRRFALGLLLVRGLRGHQGVAWFQQRWQKQFGRKVC